MSYTNSGTQEVVFVVSLVGCILNTLVIFFIITKALLITGSQSQYVYAFLATAKGSLHAEIDCQRLDLQITQLVNFHSLVFKLANCLWTYLVSSDRSVQIKMLIFLVLLSLYNSNGIC